MSSAIKAPINPLVGDRLRLFRTRLNLTGATLSRQLGVSQQTLTNWEIGASRMSPEHLERAAAAVGVNIDDFFSDDPPPPLPSPAALLLATKMQKRLMPRAEDVVLDPPRAQAIRMAAHMAAQLMDAPPEDIAFIAELLEVRRRVRAESSRQAEPALQLATADSPA